MYHYHMSTSNAIIHLVFYLQDMEAYEHGNKHAQEQELFDSSQRYQHCICCLIRLANLHFIILRLIAT